MVEAGIDDMHLDANLAKALKIFLQGGTCEIAPNGNLGTVESSWGLKQGSKDAPFERTVFVIQVLGEIVRDKGLRWVGPRAHLCK